jgi:5-deoxy-5-amino-3-dehydroquinate synthase
MQRRSGPRSTEIVRTIAVPLGERTYDVHVGAGSIARLPDLVPSRTRRVAVVTQPAIPFTGAVCALLADRELTRIDIGAGEESKSLVTVEHIARAFARAGMTRDDVVVAVGGGMVTDVAGFAAAVWHRGIAVVHVATSLLAMVDAAIGGKTGVNLPEGKNLVGAFWQPAGVVCDTDALATLPPRERRSGDGEMAKYHFLTGDELDALPLDERIARCVEIKAEFVAADEREGGPVLGGAQNPGLGGAQKSRALLNYGHTLAHALEIATAHGLTHGEAVGVGLVYAAELAAALGRIDSARVTDHRHVVGGTYTLPTTIPAGTDDDQLLELMGRDKKARDGLTFVLDGPRGVEVVSGVDPAAARAALAAVR